jgi:hypothetical protein
MSGLFLRPALAAASRTVSGTFAPGRRTWKSGTTVGRQLMPAAVMGTYVTPNLGQ